MIRNGPCLSPALGGEIPGTQFRQPLLGASGPRLRGPPSSSRAVCVGLRQPLRSSPRPEQVPKAGQFWGQRTPPVLGTNKDRLSGSHPPPRFLFPGRADVPQAWWLRLPQAEREPSSAKVAAENQLAGAHCLRSRRGRI